MNNSEKKIYNFDELYKIINELKSIFFSLSLNTKKQSRIKELFKELSKELNKDYSKELDNIKDNNIYSYLKSIDLVDKCAHGLDDDINDLSLSFIDMYNNYSSNKLDNVTFMHSFNDVCPDIEKINKELIKYINNIFIKDDRYITDNEFKNIYDTLNNSKEIDINNLIDFLLNDLKINAKSEENALEILSVLRAKSNKIYEAYLYKKYNIGMSLVNLQNELFDIKNYYLEMISESLKDNNNNIDYKLIKNDNGKEGFEHTLVINDKKSNYHTQINIPNIMKDKFNYTKEDIIEDGHFTILGDYLEKHKIHSYDDILRFADNLTKNENYSIEVSSDIAYNYYINIYRSLNQSEKTSFILESLYNQNESYDLLDQQMIDRLRNIYELEDNNDHIIPLILIYKNKIKDLYKKEKNISYDEFLNTIISKYEENNHEKRI